MDVIMNKEELFIWVSRDDNADDYIKGFSNTRDGVRNYECLVGLVDDGYITIDNLNEYGFKMPPVGELNGVNNDDQ